MFNLGFYIMLERYQAYAIARQNNFLQGDEIRREEDYEPLGFNYIQLGLGDVLLNPRTMEVFTPNTGQTTSLGEVRADNYKRDSLGRFAGNGGGGGGSSSSGKSSEKVDKSQKSGKIKKRPKTQKIGKKERTRLQHQIATDFPKLKADGKIHNYENRNHFYQFTVNETGSYRFTYKLKLEGNQEIISKIRKGEL